METLIYGVMALVAVWGYFFPTIVAHGKKKRNTMAIFVLNLTLGWTVIGWFAALIWASMVDA